MRDYILTQSIARDSTFAFPKLRRMVRNWFFKRDLRDPGAARRLHADRHRPHAGRPPPPRRPAARRRPARRKWTGCAKPLAPRHARRADQNSGAHRPVERPEPGEPFAHRPRRVPGRARFLRRCAGLCRRGGVLARRRQPASRAAPKAGPVSEPSCSSTRLVQRAGQDLHPEAAREPPPLTAMRSGRAPVSAR